MVAVCGGGHPMFAARLASPLPLWFFHAANDNCVAVEETDAVVEAIRAARAGTSGAVRYTRYAVSNLTCATEAFVGHNSWDLAYREPELVPWLLAAPPHP
jgi:predicted peptidase